MIKLGFSLQHLMVSRRRRHHQPRSHPLPPPSACSAARARAAFASGYGVERVRSGVPSDARVAPRRLRTARANPTSGCHAPCDRRVVSHARQRRRRAVHPGDARARLTGDDRTLYPCRHQQTSAGPRRDTSGQAGPAGGDGRGRLTRQSSCGL